MLQFAFDFRKGFRGGSVGGVGDLGLFRQVAPMFVHPHPGRGIGTEGVFKDVPALLRNLLRRRVL